MVKISMDRPNIILTSAMIMGTTCEKSDIAIFISDAAASSGFDSRRLKKMAIFIDSIVDVLDVGYKLSAYFLVHI